MISEQDPLGSSPERLLQAHPLDLGPYEDVYKHFHSHPEVSLHENDTASTIAKHPALSAYTVHTSIGGCGLAGVLRNGNGPTILLRADMDALFVEEKTGLNYASKAKMIDDADGQQKSVMHACGHDMHITCLLAAAEWLAKDEVQQEWAGIVIVVFQPNEERGEGAQAMVDDGLYEKVPIPDVVLAQHVMPLREGQVALKSGPAVAAADSFEVTLFGRGGHGSMPESCIDPVLLAANVIVRLQGIVSREISPSEVAVLTIGSVQAGQAENVIPDQALLKIDVRSENHATREKVLRAMRRIVEKVRSLTWFSNERLVLSRANRSDQQCRNAKLVAAKSRRVSSRPGNSH